MSFDDMPQMPQMYLPGAQDYADKLLAASKQVAAQTRTAMDVAYGSDYWQKVDFYLPEGENIRDLPVFCVIHGGAFRNGFKEWMGFMAPPFLRHPAIYVSFNYRLFPQVKLRHQVADCFDALKLVFERVEDFGGSPEKVFICGHSAGGHLAALLALRGDLAVDRSMPENVIKGAFPGSGIFDLRRETIKTDSLLAKICEGLFDSEHEAEDFSPIMHIGGNTVPFLVTWGTEDIPGIIESSERFVEALKCQPCVVEQCVWPGLDHFEANRVQSDPNNPWLTKTLDWISYPPVPA